MARIPLFQQQQLASQRTGVPDSGNAGLTLSQGTLQSANSAAGLQLDAQKQAGAQSGALASIASEAFSAVNEELRIRQAQQAYMKKQLDEQNKSAAIDQYSAEGRLKLSDAAAQQRMANPGNPEQAIKNFRGMPAQILAQMKQDYQLSPEVAQGISKNLNTELLAENDKLLSWQVEQNRDNQKAGVKSLFSELKKRAGLVNGNLDALAALQSGVESQRSVTESNFGKNAGNLMIQQAYVDNATEFIMREAARDPYRAKDLFEKNSAFAIIGGTDRNQIDRTIKTSIDLKEKEVERDMAFQGMAREQEIQTIKMDVLANPDDRSAVAATRKELLTRFLDYKKMPAGTAIEQRYKLATLKLFESAINNMDSRLDEFKSQDRQAKSDAEHLAAQGRLATAAEEHNKLVAKRDAHDLMMENHNADGAVQARADLHALINSRLPGGNRQVKGTAVEDNYVLKANAMLTNLHESGQLLPNEYQNFLTQINESSMKIQDYHQSMKVGALEAAIEGTKRANGSTVHMDSQRWRYEDQPMFQQGRALLPGEKKIQKDWDMKNQILDEFIQSGLANGKLSPETLVKKDVQKRLNEEAYKAARRSDVDEWFKSIRKYTNQSKAVHRAIDESLRNVGVHNGGTR